MAGIRVDVQGLNKLISKYEKRANALNAKEIVTIGAALFERQAKAITPVDTGRLRASIHTDVQGNSSQAEGSTGTNVEYAPYVEFGTSKAKAQPYLRPAARIVKPKIDRIAIEKIREAMDI